MTGQTCGCGELQALSFIPASKSVAARWLLHATR